MSKGSGLTNRNFGLNHTNGKGDASRITDIKAYRANYENIDWGSGQHRLALRPGNRTIPIVHRRSDGTLKTLRELEEEHEWRMGL